MDLFKTLMNTILITLVAFLATFIAYAVWAAAIPGLLVFFLGITLAILVASLRMLNEDPIESRNRVEANGVHWFWWLFWAIAFLPALILVAIIHIGRKNRAAIRESKQ